MLRDKIKRPNRIGAMYDSVEYQVDLFNRANGLNTVTFEAHVDLYTKVRIYGNYNWHDDNGYVDYIICTDNPDYLEIKCVDNTMRSRLPFGINVNFINADVIEISFTYIGEQYRTNGQHFTFVFSRLYSKTSMIDFPKIKNRSRLEIDYSNFMFLPQCGDNFFRHSGDTSDYTSRTIPKFGNGNLILSGIADYYKDPATIRIPKRFEKWYVIASIANGSIIYTSEKVYYKNICYIVDTKLHSIPKEIPLYIESAILVPDPDTTSIKFPTYKSSGAMHYSSEEMWMIYDSEDKFYWYYHIGCDRNLLDNIIEIHGITPQFSVEPRPGVAPLSILTEKKLQNNTHILNKICDSKHIFYSSFLYRSGVDRYDYRVA